MKRFTDTSKWDDPWFMELSPEAKCLWMYICDRCDAAGVIDFNARLAAVQIGYSIPYPTFELFGERVKKLPSGKWRIMKFLPFQYGRVDARCPAHKPLIRCIHLHQLEVEIDNLPNRVADTLPDRVQEKEEDTHTEKVWDKNRNGPRLWPTRPENWPKTEEHARAIATTAGVAPEMAATYWLHYEGVGEWPRGNFGYLMKAKAGFKENDMAEKMELEAERIRLRSQSPNGGKHTTS